MQHKLLTAKEAADYLDVEIHLLNRWRYKKVGPEYIRIGGQSPRYKRSVLDEYIGHYRVREQN